jgi:hypothetical protein
MILRRSAYVKLTRHLEAALFVEATPRSGLNYWFVGWLMRRSTDCVDLYSFLEEYRGGSRKPDVIVDQTVVQRHAVSISSRALTRNYC